MKFGIICIVCVVVSSAALSQTVREFTGAKIDEEVHGTFSLLQADSSHLYALRYKDGIYFLDIYDKATLQRSHLVKIPLPSRDSAKFSLENVFIQKDRYQVFYSWFDKTVSAQKLEMLSFDTGGNKIGDTKLIDRSEGPNQKKAGDFLVINRKEFNEFLSYGYKTAKDSFYISIDHFDYLGNKTGAQDFASKIEEDNAVHSWLDRDFNLYRLSRNKWGARNVKWSINVYVPGAGNATTVMLKLPETEKIYLSNFFKFYPDSDGNLNFISTYSNSPATNKADGIYIARLSRESHNLESENAIPLKLNAIGAEVFSLSSGMLTTILPLRGKGLRTVFESRLETTSTVYGISVDRQFDIGNIFTVDLDSNRAVRGIHNIHKQQRTNPANYKYTGFIPLHSGDRSYFIYNELPENLGRATDKMKRVNSSKMDETAIIYTMVTSGEDNITRTILIDKNGSSRVDALLPNSYLSEKNTVYALRRMDSDNYLIKIFLTD